MCWRYLPVDVALSAYGLSDDPFEVPPSDGEVVRLGPKLTTWKESNKVADACYEYFGDLRWTEPYAKLLDRIADEVFHIMFLNRRAMAGLNSYIALHVQDLDADTVWDMPELAKVLTSKGGRVKRTSSVPSWVKRAVFFRDHGRCSTCGADLTGLIDSLPRQHFDHMVPIANGGLNDITNLQLLCEPCNLAKSSSLRRPSDRYRRWY